MSGNHHLLNRKLVPKLIYIMTNSMVKTHSIEAFRDKFIKFKGDLDNLWKLDFGFFLL